MALEERFLQIKDNVWKMEKEGQYYSVKRYASLSTALKVHFIHKELQSINYPHIVKVNKTDDPLTFIQPWMKGARAANFKRRSDRIDSLAALRLLHNTNKQIDWKASPYLHEYPLLQKWEERLARFINISHACEAYIGKDSVEKIISYATQALRKVRKSYKPAVEPTLLHGDVVHHNILRGNDDFVRLIDFDLACTGSQDIELALWIHRVLPQIDYQITYLFQEQTALQSMDPSLLCLLLYPNELLREWLHVFTLPPDSRVKQVKLLVPFTETALSHWPQLWREVEQMR